MQTSFVQALIAPLGEPLAVISAHDGYVMAANPAMEAVARSMGAEVIIGEDAFEVARLQGLEVEAMPAYKAKVYGGRHTNTLSEPIAIHLIASRQEQYILCSAWHPDEVDEAGWAHDWLWLGLKNAIQMDAASKQAAAATDLLMSLQRTLAEMQATYVERAGLWQDSRYQRPPSRPWRALRST